MNLLSRNTDYAIRALLYMAQQPDALVSTADLYNDLKLPRPFMRKSLQRLQQEGYLMSVKGNKGGFRLKVSPSRIRLIDLMRIFQGEISLSECLFKKKVCGSRSICPLRKQIKGMEEILLARLYQVTVADLLKDI